MFWHRSWIFSTLLCLLVSLASAPGMAWASELTLITSKSTGMQLTLIPAGTFVMGSPVTESGRGWSEGPQHTVQISRPFYIGVYEVTQAEYEGVMGRNPSQFTKNGEGGRAVDGLETSRFPVEEVSWNDAREFCGKLSVLEGATYRLPTEAEWEYACRGKTTTPFHFGSSLNGDKANVNGNYPYGTTTKGPSLGRTTMVGAYPKNPFGLFDMHGNVWEWCEDWYDEYSQATSKDPQGPSTGKFRVIRGGGWDIEPVNCRATDRNEDPQTYLYISIGFRVVRVWE